MLASLIPSFDWLAIAASGNQDLGSAVDWPQKLSAIVGVLQFGVVVAGVLIALRSLFSAQSQRKLENAFRLVNLFDKEIEESDLKWWRRIFEGASDPAGAREGHVKLPSHLLIEWHDDPHCDEIMEIPLEAFFTEGPPDQGALGRIAQILDVICHELNTGSAEPRVVYYSLGQIMTFTAQWVSEAGFAKNDQYGFPNLLSFMDKSAKKLEKWPCRILEHCG